MSKRIITLGTWDGKPIEWYVLKEKSFGTLVISKTALFSCRFNSNKNNGNKWANSELRKYLNNDFFKKAFSDYEKKQIVNVYLSEPSKTKDNVFVLSVEEADTFMTQQERSNGSMQWTRSPNKNVTRAAWRIVPDGGFDESGKYDFWIHDYIYVDYSFDVRPAMYIKE